MKASSGGVFLKTFLSTSLRYMAKWSWTMAYPKGCEGQCSPFDHGSLS